MLWFVRIWISIRSIKHLEVRMPVIVQLQR
nr:MAG TPA: hypothetical protein [Caudoviricetes sp.]